MPCSLNVGGGGGGGAATDAVSLLVCAVAFTMGKAAAAAGRPALTVVFSATVLAEVCSWFARADSLCRAEAFTGLSVRRCFTKNHPALLNTASNKAGKTITGQSDGFLFP